MNLNKEEEVLDLVNRERIIEEFMELVQIDSETRKEREINNYLKNKLEALGLTVFEDEAGEKIGGNAGNLIAELPGKKEGLRVLLCAHMDTVQPGKGVKPILENGIIRSQGETILGADNKSGICAILEMLRVIKEENLEHGPIQIVFTVAEEGGLNGSKNLDQKLLKADLAYVLDSDGSAGEIIVQAPAQKSLLAKIKGKAAHAGIAPEEGVSAIQIAARGIAKMKLGRIDEETTANIGVIKGGKATNIIPDLVELEGEARSLKREKLEKQCQHMVDCLQQAAQELGGQIEAKVELVYPEINLDEKEMVVLLAKKAAENLGFPVKLEKTGGGSDANILNGYGIPTANLGCGMKKVHTTEEYITVEDLVKNPQYLVEIIKVAAQLK